MRTMPYVSGKNEASTKNEASGENEGAGTIK